MARIITAIDDFPSSVSETIIQKDSHRGTVTVQEGGDLTIEGSFSGSFTINRGGKLTIQGYSNGKITNRGKLKIEGRLQGDCDNYGEYELAESGRHEGKALNLKNGSDAFIKGKGTIDVFSEQGAKLDVSPDASLSSSSGNQEEAIVNGGAIAIGGGNVAHSLRSTGSIVFTGNSIFK